jgi:hypothetical protein
MGSRVLSLDVKQVGLEAYHTSPSAEIKNAWSYVYFPPYFNMAWCLVKHQGQLYLYYIVCEVGTNPSVPIGSFRIGSVKPHL